jgi:hypothetical protein
MNQYDRMMRGQVGEIEIGEPTAKGAATKGANYSDKEFNVQDRTDLAIYDGVAIAPGATHTIVVSPSTPFKPETMSFPSWMTPGLVIQDVKFGATSFIDGGSNAGAASGIPADSYSEVATDKSVDYPTIQTGQPAQVILFNDSLAAITPRGQFRGYRVR